MGVIERIRFKGKELDVNVGGWLLMDLLEYKHQALYLGHLENFSTELVPPYSDIHKFAATFDMALLFHKPLLEYGESPIPLIRDRSENGYIPDFLINARNVGDMWVDPREIEERFSQGWERKGEIYVPWVRQMIAS